MSNSDILAGLTLCFDKELADTDQKEIDELASMFQDIIDNPIIIGANKLIVKRHQYSSGKKDGLPDFFSKYNEKFVHVITRKANTNKREFRPERANRIHWIRPIIELSYDKRITCFSYIESDGSIRDYFWFRSKMYIVIIENIGTECCLITGFCVDADNKDYYQRKYINRIK